jgi:FixJ family two-component response regulator
MREEPVVYVLDDDSSVCKSLMRLFGVVGFRCQAFTTARDFLSLDRVQLPSCLVLDVQLGHQSGLDLQSELRKRGWRTPIVFISGHSNVAVAVEAMRSGAVHFLPKPFTGRELLAAVREAIDRDRQFQHQVQEKLHNKALITSLTPREREVFALVSAGMANKNIAVRLHLSLQTIKLHRGRVMKKLEADSVADLVRLAEKVQSVDSYEANVSGRATPK